jgi:hypothetical protein
LTSHARGKGIHITGEIDAVGGGKLNAAGDAARYRFNLNGLAALVLRVPKQQLGDERN